ncbi:hypothetical protein ACFL27_21105 [candidate division CSSED10-310 bacterium]|uniref:Uncharacterized protein n=1 Tax=candidate division CSSED10-310 bacterium TaxID=2855610 RepID=A0ABV6Z2X9_UNCC1
MKQYKFPYSQILFFVVMIGVGWYIWRNVDQINRFSFHFSWLYLSLSYLTTILAYLVLFTIWLYVSASFGLKAPVLIAAKAWFLSHLGKYVPGKITMLLLRVDTYQGYSKHVVVVSTFVEYFSILAANFLLILIALAFPREHLPDYFRWFAGLGLLFFLCLLWPPFLQRLIVWSFRLLKHKQMLTVPPYHRILRYICSYIVVGLLQGFTFFFCLCAYSPLDASYYLTITGIYFSVTIVGQFAVFTPSGLGVREGLLFIALSFLIPKPVVIVTTLTVRLIYITSELLLATVFFSLEKITGTRKALI